MNIIREAMAGTLESNDVQVRVGPATGLFIDIDSIVLNQFGEQIRQAVLETLEGLGVKTGSISLQDKGAIECTIKARVETAVLRAREDKA